MGELSKGSGISSIRGGDFELGANGVSSIATLDVVVEDITPIALLPLEDSLDVVVGTAPTTFTRSTIATFTDRDDGLIKSVAANAARFESDGFIIESASTNENVRSEELDDAAWTKTTSTISADAALAPDGNTAADKIVEDSSDAIHRISQTITVASSTDSYTLSCYASGTERFLQLGLTISAGDFGIVTFDLSGAGSVTDTGVSAGTVDNSDIELISGNIYRCQMTYSPATASTTRIVIIGLSDLGTGFTPGSRGSATYLGDSSSGVNAWGAFPERFPFASSYISTADSSVLRELEDSSISASNIPAPTADYSVCLTVDHVDLDASLSQVLYSVDGETSRRIQWNTTTGAIEAIHGAVTSISTTTFSAGDKVDVCFVVDGTNQTLFINGVQEDQDAKGTVTGTATAIDVGHQAGSNQAFSHIKDFRIYDVALTAPQVQAI